MENQERSNFLYRYVDDWANKKAKLVELPIVKETPCGHRVKMYPWDSKTRFVSSHTTKRYAWPTKEEAFESYVYRKMAAVSHCIERLEGARRQLEIAKGMLPEGDSIEVDPDYPRDITWYRREE